MRRILRHVRNQGTNSEGTAFIGGNPNNPNEGNDDNEEPQNLLEANSTEDEVCETISKKVVLPPHRLTSFLFLSCSTLSSL